MAPEKPRSVESTIPVPMETDDDDEEIITIVEQAVPLSASELERKKTLKELKDMCVEKGLSNLGKKAELAKRLVDL